MTEDEMKRIRETPCHFHNYYEYTAIYEDPDEKDEDLTVQDCFSPGQMVCIAAILAERQVGEALPMTAKKDKKHLPGVEMMDNWYNHDIRTFEVTETGLKIEFKQTKSGRDGLQNTILINGEVTDIPWPED